MSETRLYLVQHAEARREEEDPVRPLTENGRAEARRVAHYGVAHAGVRARRIVHSGKLRAQQTAEVWKQFLSAAEVTQADGLDPMANPKIWADRLTREEQAMMLVGHLPHLKRLASLLLCGDSEKEVVAFRYGGVVCLQRDEEDRWSLRWALTPEVVPEEALEGEQ